jgi:hypothetical protein
MFILDLDPNVVKPGWTALVITILLALALVLLYLSMRRQFKKINIPSDETDVEQSDVEPSDLEPDDGDAPAPSDSPSAKT